MTLEEKYQLALETLEHIASFGHEFGCRSSAPVHECCCNVLDERELAQGCLVKLGER